ncbi:hypothetical protein RS81_03079 [Microbacterium terrae]|uniref:DUF3099 domain-containing protein n=2 Tax=Microbacterium terrae TaxID=69369 RepID=A0A0M2H361_9MICO|nr:hypothetical protein RS81_03079 [Microbacterium terrae]
MMGVRIACFILMVVITPYGWYTWVLGAAAILIPYIAVVSANVGEEARRNRPEDPQPTLAATPHPTDVDPETHPVLRLHESADSPDSPATTPDDPDSDSPAPTGGTA